MEEVSRHELQSQLEQLERELAETSCEKVRSAELGLALLREKKALSERCDALEAAHEHAQHELKIAREALVKFQSSHEQSTRSGIEQEESLLSESQARETSLNTRITDMDQELRSLRQEISRLRSEKSTALQQLSGVDVDRDLAAQERRHLHAELRETRCRESRLETDFAELEEENLTLQKQISKLRSSQMEFESMQYDQRILKEKVEELLSEADELDSLKSIAEAQLREALNNIQEEREAKHALKRELDRFLKSESMMNLSSLAVNTLRLNESHLTDSDGDNVADDGTERVGSHGNGKNSSALDRHAPAHVGDLFSEIHLDEVRKLETKLEQVEEERSGMARGLCEAQEALERSRGELESQRCRAATLLLHVQTLIGLYSSEEQEAGEQLTGHSDEAESDAKHLHQLKKVVESHRERHRLAMQEISRLQTGISDMQSSENSSTEAVVNIRNEVERLRDLLLTSESRGTDLLADADSLSELCQLGQRALSGCLERLAAVSEQLGQLYHRQCVCSGQLPRRVLLEHNSSAAAPSTGGTAENVTEDGGNSGSYQSSRFEQLISALKLVKLPLHQGGEAVDPSVLAAQVDTVSEQVVQLRHVLETSLSADADHVTSPCVTASDRGDSGHGTGDNSLASDLNTYSEQQQQILDLKGQLSSKQEQLASLRSILRANKKTAEAALSNLKSKYTSERKKVTDDMAKMRNELRVLKEEAATFSSLRSMYIARCEEHVSHADELQQLLTVADDEKRTLNNLLRMAIQQKLAVTQQLEELELDRERRPPVAHNSSRQQEGYWRRFGSRNSGVSRNRTSSLFPRPPRFSIGEPAGSSLAANIANANMCSSSAPNSITRRH